MTDDPNLTPITVTAADLRMACALLVHTGRGDDDGLRAIVAEIADAHRVLPVMLAQAQLVHEIAPLLYTEQGLAILSRHVLRLAGIAESEPS